MTSVNTSNTNEDSTSSPTENGEDKSLTFRRRRLSLTNLRQYDDSGEAEGQRQQPKKNATFDLKQLQPPPNVNVDADADISGASANNQETPATHEDDKAQTFRKRRLSSTHSREDTSSHEDHSSEPPFQRRRRASDASVSSLDSNNNYNSAGNSNNNSTHHHHNNSSSKNNSRNKKTTNVRLNSRTLHAAELLAHPPPSPSVSKLYQEKSAPPQRQPLLDPLVEGSAAPKWKKRHTGHVHEDEGTLPFPRDIVGTYSCHGVEPIYDEEYIVDDEEDDEWGVSVAQQQQPQDSDKPTTAAKINQDRGGVAFPYGNCPKTALFAVYDGHGQGGELVAQFALHEVQRRLEKHADFTKNIEKAFKETLLAVDGSLKEECLIEPLYAGTTACVCLLRETQLVLANAGDSRAVLARKQSDGTRVAIDLTKDQNPDLPEEQARIESMGGFVSPPPEPGLSARVWLDVDCTQIGLAMARSLGDHAVKEIGVIAEPVVTFHDLVPEDEFVIFATDGVWEFVSSDEAMKIVSDNLDRGATRACQALIEVAAAKWHDEEGDYRDDITALVVQLPHLWKSDHARHQQSLQAKNGIQSTSR